MLGKEQHSYRLAYYVAATYHHCALAFNLYPRLFDEAHDPHGRARHEGFLTDNEIPYAYRMEPVYILARIYRLQHLAFVKVIRQWQLHKDTVNSLVLVQIPDCGNEFFLAG